MSSNTTCMTSFNNVIDYCSNSIYDDSSPVNMVSHKQFLAYRNETDKDFNLIKCGAGMFKSYNK